MTHNIAVLPGDGIGPEIVEQAVRVLKALDVPFDIKQAPVGGAAFDAFEHLLPPATPAGRIARLFGAVGDWKYDSLPREFRPEQAILACARRWACSPTCVPPSCTRNWPAPRRSSPRSCPAWTSSSSAS